VLDGVYSDEAGTVDDTTKDECIRDDAYATGIAVGDLDEDGVDEIVVTYKTTADDEARLIVYENFDDETYDGNEISVLGNLYTDIESTIGSNDFYITDTDIGDLDLSTSDAYTNEIVASFYANGEDALRFVWIDWDADADAPASEVFGGDGWTSVAYGTHLTIGRPTSDQAALAISRYVTGIENEEDSYGKLKIYTLEGDVSVAPLEFVSAANLGTELETDVYGNWVSMCDLNGDGLDETLLSIYDPDEGVKLQVYGDGVEEFQPTISMGESWFDKNYATSTDCGDVDGDGIKELIVTRSTDDYGEVRFLIYRWEESADSEESSEDASGEISEDETENATDDSAATEEPTADETGGTTSDDTTTDDTATEEPTTDETGDATSDDTTTDESTDTGTDTSAATSEETEDDGWWIFGCGYIGANGEQDASMLLLLGLALMLVLHRRSQRKL
jgi:hypothetical protein